MELAPQLSVIIAAYNAEKYIAQCLSSVLRFRSRTMEVLVVDDGSVDGTAHVARSFGDPRITVLVQQNRGPSAARNAALRQARGAFVLPFDADDVAAVENWDMLISALDRSPRAVLALGKHWDFTGEDDPSPRKFRLAKGRVEEIDAAPRIFSSNFVPMGAVFVRRDALERAGLWNECLRMGEDWDLWCRLACLGPFLSCKAVVMGHRVHDLSATGAPIEAGCEDPGLAAVEAIHSNPMVRRVAGTRCRTYRRKALAWQTYHWGTRLIRNGAPLAGAKALAWSISHDPTRLAYLCGFPLRRLRRMRELSCCALVAGCSAFSAPAGVDVHDAAESWSFIDACRLTHAVRPSAAAQWRGHASRA